MRRLKFKPNLGASRGAGGGSGACVGGGRVRGVVGRVQQGGRQSGDESTGGESTSEVETGQLIERRKSKEREEEGNLSRCRPEGPVGGRETEGQQEGTDDDRNLSSDVDMTVKRTTCSEVHDSSIPHSVEAEADMTSKNTTEDDSLVSRSTLMQKKAGIHRPRKKVAPKIVSVRPRRHLQGDKDSRVDVTLNQQDGSDSRDPSKESPAVVRDSSVGVLDGRSTVEGRSESEASETVSSRVSSRHGNHSSSNPPGGLQPVQRSTENIRTHSAGLESESVHGRPSGQDCTDEAISNTLNEVLQGVHASAELASTGSNFSGIARSNLDLICPPPLLSQVGGEEDETLMVDSRRADTLGKENCQSGKDSLHKEPSAVQHSPSTSIAPVSNKRTTTSSRGSTVDVVSGGRDGENLENQSSSTGSKLSQGDVSKEKRKRPAKSGTKRKRSSVSAPNDGDDPTVPSSPSPSPTPSPSSSQPKRPRTSSGRASRKVREAPDRATMTMQDLIYYNPSANPMSSTVEDKRRKQLAREEGRGEGELQEKGERMPTQTQNPLFHQQENRVMRDGEGDEEEEDEGRIVPQLKIGKDGSIVLDEESMVVETTKKTLTEESSELVFESSSHTTSASFRKSIRVSRWTREETSKFFRALSQVGTDFTMMTLLIPRRSRKELKNKFKKEEKNNPHLVTQALKNQLSLQKLQQ